MITKTTIIHADHGITADQMDFIKNQLAFLKPGFFIRQVDLPEELGTVPCMLYGPAMGDEPIVEDDCFYERRSMDRPPDRFIFGAPDHFIFGAPRKVNYVQVIGMVKSLGSLEYPELVLYTVYGGPLAPRNQWEAGLSDEERAESKAFWDQHALALDSKHFRK